MSAQHKLFMKCLFCPELFETSRSGHIWRHFHGLTDHTLEYLDSPSYKEYTAKSPPADLGQFQSFVSPLRDIRESSVQPAEPPIPSASSSSTATAESDLLTSGTKADTIAQRIQAGSSASQDRELLPDTMIYCLKSVEIVLRRCDHQDQTMDEVSETSSLQILDSNLEKEAREEGEIDETILMRDEDDGRKWEDGEIDEASVLYPDEIKKDEKEELGLNLIPTEDVFLRHIDSLHAKQAVVTLNSKPVEEQIQGAETGRSAGERLKQYLKSKLETITGTGGQGAKEKGPVASKCGIGKETNSKDTEPLLPEVDKMKNVVGGGTRLFVVNEQTRGVTETDYGSPSLPLSAIALIPLPPLPPPPPVPSFETQATQSSPSPPPSPNRITGNRKENDRSRGTTNSTSQKAEDEKKIPEPITSEITSTTQSAADTTAKDKKEPQEQSVTVIAKATESVEVKIATPHEIQLVDLCDTDDESVTEDGEIGDRTVTVRDFEERMEEFVVLDSVSDHDDESTPLKTNISTDATPATVSSNMEVDSASLAEKNSRDTPEKEKRSQQRNQVEPAKVKVDKPVTETPMKKITKNVFQGQGKQIQEFRREIEKEKKEKEKQDRKQKSVKEQNNRKGKDISPHPYRFKSVVRRSVSESSKFPPVSASPKSGGNSEALGTPNTVVKQLLRRSIGQVHNSRTTVPTVLTRAVPSKKVGGFNPFLKSMEESITLFNATGNDDLLTNLTAKATRLARQAEMGRDLGRVASSSDSPRFKNKRPKPCFDVPTAYDIRRFHPLNEESRDRESDRNFQRRKQRATTYDWRMERWQIQDTQEDAFMKKNVLDLLLHSSYCGEIAVSMRQLRRGEVSVKENPKKHTPLAKAISQGLAYRRREFGKKKEGRNKTESNDSINSSKRKVTIVETRPDSRNSQGRNHGHGDRNTKQTDSRTAERKRGHDEDEGPNPSSKRQRTQGQVKNNQSPPPPRKPRNTSRRSRFQWQNPQRNRWDPGTLSSDHRTVIPSSKGSLGSNQHLPNHKEPSNGAVWAGNRPPWNMTDKPNEMPDTSHNRGFRHENNPINTHVMNTGKRRKRDLYSQEQFQIPPPPNNYFIPDPPQAGYASFDSAPYIPIPPISSIASRWNTAFVNPAFLQNGFPSY